MPNEELEFYKDLFNHFFQTYCDYYGFDAAVWRLINFGVTKEQLETMGFESIYLEKFFG